jgi:hypothetical protein
VLPGTTATEGIGDFVARLARLAQSRGIDAATVEKEFFAMARPSSTAESVDRLNAAQSGTVCRRKKFMEELNATDQTQRIQS